MALSSRRHSHLVAALGFDEEAETGEPVTVLPNRTINTNELFTVLEDELRAVSLKVEVRRLVVVNLLAQLIQEGQSAREVGAAPSLHSFDFSFVVLPGQH